MWRETLMHDVGIDGQIEHCTPEGLPTGRVVAVQAKSGSSYFKQSDERGVIFHPKERHRKYWESFPLPVILFLYDPGEDRGIWTDARQQLRSNPGSPIIVPFSSSFDPAAVLRALESEGPLPIGEFNPDQIVGQLIGFSTKSKLFDITYFDLLVHGLTDIGRSIHFSADLAYAIAAHNDLIRDEPIGTITYTPHEREFIDGYATFLIANDIARLDYDAWRRLKSDGIFGTFISPLTSRGCKVIERIHFLDKQLAAGPPSGYHQVAMDRTRLFDYRGALERAERVTMFKDEYSHLQHK